MGIASRILGAGANIPERKITNEDVLERLRSSSEGYLSEEDREAGLCVPGTYRSFFPECGNVACASPKRPSLLSPLSAVRGGMAWLQAGTNLAFSSLGNKS